jgi:hypothetical protein
MEIDKETIVGMLRERGQSDEAARAEQELPERVDPDRDAGLLEQFEIDPGDLVGRLTGGADVPGP